MSVANTPSLLERRSAPGAALLVIDVQERLMAVMRHREPVVANIRRLLDAARILEVPAFCTEQYPKGLGPTVPELLEFLPDSERRPKTTFHAAAVPGLLEDFRARGVRYATLVGVEAHVCVAQTALELLALGYGVQIPADAVASRAKLDWEFALRRLERAGAVVTTAEAVLFEWLETASHPRFKEISKLVVKSPPPDKA